jgi:diacylglycerol O-acyltransferase / wax synthase
MIHRLSGTDTGFLYGETPSWHMHVSAVLVIDPTSTPEPFTFDRLRKHIAERVHDVPQFRWKLRQVPFGLDRPVMVEDLDFDVDYHLRHVAVPPPGGPEQLGNLIGEIVSWKLDRNRPLWEMWLIDGLEHGYKALLAKIHHSIIDGVSGSELATVLLDLDPNPPEREAPVDERSHEGVPGDVELFVRGLGQWFLTPWRLARFGRQSVRQLRRVLPLQRRESAPPIPFQSPRTRFNAQLTPHRRFAYTTISLADAKQVKDAFDVKLNDVVLALCAGALRRYLEAYDELPPEPLIAQCPVSTRPEEDKREVGTQVAAMFASLATDIDDPGARLMAINESTQGAKQMQSAMSAEKIMGISEAAGPALIELAARMYTAAGLDTRTRPVMNLIISNVPGPPFPLYTAGATVKAMYPMGPLLFGTGINITVFSYVDRIDFGFMVCREVVPDPWAIADGIPIALAELTKAAEALPT